MSLLFQTTESRRANMRAIRSKGNRTTEKKLRGMLIRASIRGWKMHVRLEGAPDFWFEGIRLAVFVDGCFWHACRRCGRVPRTNTEYWRCKLRRNAARDKAINRRLRGSNIRIIRIRECELRTRPRLQLRRILKATTAAAPRLRLE